MNDIPLVSIGVPTCNRAGSLEQALQSLLTQDYPNLEIIVSDNASTDDTGALCARLAKQHPSLQYHRHPDRLAAAANFTSVLRRARGDYFMWAADDDLWEPAFVSTLARRLNANPRLVLAMCEAQYRLADGRRLPFFAEGAFWRHPPSGAAGERLMSIARHNYGNLIYGLYRRAALLTPAGTILDAWQYLNEIPVFLRVAEQGEIEVCPEVLFFKTVGLGTYLYAAREYYFSPPSDQLPACPDGLGSKKTPAMRQLAGSLYQRFRAAIQAPKSAIGHFKYHYRAWQDICRAVHGLGVTPELKRALRRCFLARLTAHCLKLVVVWNFQDIFLPRRHS